MITVFIVDDSALVRQSIVKLLQNLPDIKLCGFAQDPLFAWNKMQTMWPDVIISDIEMPRMNGLEFVKKIMNERPTPVIICSSIAQNGSSVAIEAMQLGAVEVLEKPRIEVEKFFLNNREQFVQAIHAAAKSHPKSVRTAKSAVGIPTRTVHPVRSSSQMLPNINPSASLGNIPNTQTLIAIGASTGGVVALDLILKNLHPDVPGIVIVQHMPPVFTNSFAMRLNDSCHIEVREAKDQDEVRQGLALIAPGDKHLMIRRSRERYFVEIKDGPKVSQHRPSVDVLFQSCAQQAGRNTVGVILTGMGKDGARGLNMMHKQGSLTLAQDEESCVVFRMPKEAIALGGVDHIVKLGYIASALNALPHQGKYINKDIRNELL